ncbi:MAG: hypothetical protein JWQ87_4822 [Candidatus Sulfotelmatobacter sp.]|jgi:hypothetical protein|nr:hypothetical protein [Candidatus Sulfotelmatobacter sp.]
MKLRSRYVFIHMLVSLPMFSRRLLSRRMFSSVLLLTVSVMLAGDAATAPRKFSKLPSKFVWAWERPEDLRFLPPAIGVAFLADTINVQGVAVSERWRGQPLKVNPGTALVAVIRIETQAADNSSAIRDRVAASVVRAAQLPNVVGVQIDYDARRSERDFYASALRQIHEQLPAEKFLSITALASWCQGDRWLSGLPINEAVPMMFRLGAERDEFVRFAKSGRSFREPLCRDSVGVSTDEDAAIPAGTSRYYWFSPRPWTGEDLKKTDLE